MTIVEEIDKKSNRPHRSKNIVDALKYAFDLKETPQNIGEAVKAGLGTGGGGYKGVKAATISLSTKSVPEGETPPDYFEVSWTLKELVDDEWHDAMSNTQGSSMDCYYGMPVDIEVPVVDGMRTSFTVYGGNSETKFKYLSDNPEGSDYTGDLIVDDYVLYATGDGTYNIAWHTLD